MVALQKLVATLFSALEDAKSDEDALCARHAFEAALCISSTQFYTVGCAAERSGDKESG